MEHTLRKGALTISKILSPNWISNDGQTVIVPRMDFHEAFW